jgi:hypothetical protein
VAAPPCCCCCCRIVRDVLDQVEAKRGPELRQAGASSTTTSAAPATALGIGAQGAPVASPDGRIDPGRAAAPPERALPGAGSSFGAGPAPSRPSGVQGQVGLLAWLAQVCLVRRLCVLLDETRVRLRPTCVQIRQQPAAASSGSTLDMDFGEFSSAVFATAPSFSQGESPCADGSQPHRYLGFGHCFLYCVLEGASLASLVTPAARAWLLGKHGRLLCVFKDNLSQGAGRLTCGMNCEVYWARCRCSRVNGCGSGCEPDGS